MSAPPGGAGLDFLALGALVHRLDPGLTPFRKATECRIHVSGGEFNCAANLADCFGLATGIASAMVDYPIGDLIAERVRAMGVRPFYKRFTHDGVTGPNMAAVYSDLGFGVRPPVVFYNRANEAAAQLKRGDFDWNAIFAGRVRWFHSGGIFASLSQTAPDLIVEGMQAAQSAGATVSFDLNYRPKLWNVAGGEAGALKAITRILDCVDVLIASEQDLKRLGIPGEPQTEGSPLNAGALFAMIPELLRRHPRIRIVAKTMREVLSSNRHRWGAAAWIDGQPYTTPIHDLEVYDRVGSGDGFAAGLFYGLLTGEKSEDALMLGWAHGALVATYPGDTTMATLEQVRALAQGGSARIQR